MKLYAFPSSISKMMSSKNDQVFLIGGFSGFLNFGDVIQLQGAIQLHRQRRPEIQIFPLIHPSSNMNGMDPAFLENLFGIEDWIYFLGDDEEPLIRAGDLFSDLRGLEIKDLPAYPLIHFYGSGRLNKFWGDRTLELLNLVLGGKQHQRYLISGQQVSKEFVTPFFEHIQRWQPDLIGCRDQESLGYLLDYGIDASYSGDDALEILQNLTNQVGQRDGELNGIGLNIRQTGFTGNDPVPGGHFSAPDEFLTDLGAMFSSSNLDFPLLIMETFGYSQRQGITVEDIPELETWYPESPHINLVEAIYEDSLMGVPPGVQHLRCAVVMSYHLALYLYFIKVPVYLVGFNEYYRQKQNSLGQGEAKLEDILFIGNRDTILSRQEDWVKQAREGRREWLDRWDDF